MILVACIPAGQNSRHHRNRDLCDIFLKQLTGDRKIKIYANSFGGLNTLCSLLTKYPFLKTQGTVCVCRKHIDVIIRGIYWEKERDGGELSVPLLVDVSQAEDIFHPYYIIEYDSLDVGTL